MKRRRLEIRRPYQSGIVVYQLAKLRMIRFTIDFQVNILTDVILKKRTPIKVR